MSGKVRLKQPLVSVIVPVYNAEQYLRRCVDSILQQSYRELEIILVDDGSTDGSRQLCQEYARADQRVKVYRQKNTGLSGARNKGIAKARGEYLTFVDADDEVCEGGIAYLYEMVEKFGADLAIAGQVVTLPSGKEVERYLSDESEKILSQEEALRMLLTDEISVSAGGKMYRRELFKSIKYPVGRLCEDNGTTYKLILASKKIAWGPQQVYRYYKNAGSIMLSEYNHRKMDLVELVDMMCDEIDHQMPELKPYTEKRRIEARFSILRQALPSKLPKAERSKIAELKRYILARKKLILTDVVYTKRERAALLALMGGEQVFVWAWQWYSHLKYGSQGA